jgi:hypothetical protein
VVPEDSGRGPTEDVSAAERARLSAERARRAVERAESKVGAPKPAAKRPPARSPQPPDSSPPAVSEETLRHRRGIAIFGGLLVVAAIVALIVAGSGDDDTASQTTTALLPADSGRDVGIKVSAPPEWERNETNEVIRFRSPDGEMQVLIDYSPNSGEADAALDAELSALQQRYQVTNVREPVDREVGGLEGKEVLVSARDRGGPLNFLILSANGKDHTYVITIVSRPNAPEQTLAEGQQIVNALKLKG